MELKKIVRVFTYKVSNIRVGRREKLFNILSRSTENQVIVSNDKTHISLYSTQVVLLFDTYIDMFGIF